MLEMDNNLVENSIRPNGLGRRIIFSQALTVGQNEQQCFTRSLVPASNMELIPGSGSKEFWSLFLIARPTNSMIFCRRI
jgi:hypothetical protein